MNNGWSGCWRACSAAYTVHSLARPRPDDNVRDAVRTMTRPTDLDELFVHQSPELLPNVTLRSPHWRESYFFDIHSPDGQGDVIFFTMARYPAREVMDSLQGADVPPTTVQLNAIAAARATATKAMARWSTIKSTDVPALNAKLKAAGLAPLTP